MSMAARVLKRCAVALACSAGLIGAAQAGQSVQQVDAQTPQPAADATDRLIVKYRGSSVAREVGGGRRIEEAREIEPALLEQRVGLAQRAAQRAGVELRLLRQTGLGAHVFKLQRPLALDALQRLADELKAEDAAIEYAEPDRRMFPLFTPNDPSYGSQWDLSEATAGIRAPAAWDVATGSGVVVAVIDTGIRPHADLSGQTVAGYDMIIDTEVSNDGNGRDNDPADPGDWTSGQCGVASGSSWHGTHVAGTIAAKTNNGLGVAGVAFNAKVQAIRALGTCGGYTSDIADGIVWASGGTVSGLPANTTPARVLNLSLGGGGACDSTTQSAVNSARSRNSVVVVAAGNSNANAANYSPASCSGVITVAATDRNGARSYYSNYGSVVALAAPGGDVRASAANGILSTLNTGTTTPGADTYAYYQGTSMAAPHVAGVAALMLSVKPSATPDQIANALKSSARPFPGSCSQCGSGLLDAQAAVAAITGGGGGGGTVNESESNNSIGTANTIAAPATVNGSLASGDTDYFRVDLPAGRTLSATLTPGGSGLDHDLYIYSSSGSILARSERGAGLVDTASYGNGGSGTLTLYVRAYYYSGGAGNYTLQLGW